MSFLSRGSSTPLTPAETQQRKEQVMNEVRSQLAVANAQELINKMGDKCFVKCITKPGDSLSPSEEGCIARCTERYLEAFNVISKQYVARVGREREAAATAAGGLGGEGLN
ncbi:Tim10/DDP family zinc finger-domain-containing protein [Leucosporidium creatinivorum]|uniref:Mitochondrial import inner membrane translocase subunit n=1 Tax=Leucosporidium creatinivorum TaxID=106004 RepID=A0A1Y2FTN9_9BASI|nr:Tim10/DDP family zinc finger-domain-containing protein [Leucosporidium creatinivorum]